MKLSMVTALCFVLVAVLGTSGVEGESCLPPSRNVYTEVDKNDSRVRDFAEFAAKEMDYKLIGVNCAGKLEVRMIRYYSSNKTNILNLKKGTATMMISMFYKYKPRISITVPSKYVKMWKLLGLDICQTAYRSGHSVCLVRPHSLNKYA